jgi:cyclopropane fatty-acyl-phospholipid synthase-like methyltransferase
LILNPLQVLLWTFRRNEGDVVNLYNSLSPVMQLATGGDMLNFGYWNGGASTPAAAQRNLCSLVGGVAELHSATSVVDVGSGLAAPAAEWASAHDSLDVRCVNINYAQLLSASTNGHAISRVNATSTALPFASQSADRVIALESAQHFRPLGEFVRESRRILKPGGLLVLAIPVTARAGPSELFKLGILSFTWSSEHYGLDHVKSAIEENGFKAREVMHIGRHVYEPLTDYYARNRDSLRQKILSRYPPFLENVLYKSLLKMKAVSEKGIIDYVIVKAS